MDEYLALLILVLAAIRTSMMLAYDNGPFGVLSRLRDRLERFKIETEPWPWLSYLFGQFLVGMTCTWCNSIWVAAAWGVPYLIWPQITPLVAFPFAVSALVMIWERHFS